MDRWNLGSHVGVSPSCGDTQYTVNETRPLCIAAKSCINKCTANSGNALNFRCPRGKNEVQQHFNVLGACADACSRHKCFVKLENNNSSATHETGNQAHACLSASREILEVSNLSQSPLRTPLVCNCNEHDGKRIDILTVFSWSNKLLRQWLQNMWKPGPLAHLHEVRCSK